MESIGGGRSAQLCVLIAGLALHDGCGVPEATLDAAAVDAAALDAAALDAAALDAAALDVPDAAALDAPDAAARDAPDAAAVECDDFTIAPSPAAFGDVLLGSTSTPMTFTVSNTGSCSSAPLVVVLGGRDAAQFRITPGSDRCAGAVLTPGATCTLDVVLAPLVVGSFSATLGVTARETVPAVLSGGCTSFGPASFEPSTHDFGAVVIGASSTPRAFTLRNYGSGPTGPIGIAVAGTNPSDFVIVADTCGGVALPGGESCAVEITFTPTTAGARSATLRASATPGGSVTAALTGVGE